MTAIKEEAGMAQSGDARPVLLNTDMANVTLLNRGKVRDIYDLGDTLLIVATDRISAFDHILPTGIPRKGEVLTQISRFWFDFLGDRVAHHVITTDPALFPDELQPFIDQLAGRAMLVKKAEVLPVECIVRGYLAGSGWKEYQREGTVCGIPLPEGLDNSSKLPEPIFTPSTKAEGGLHDENIPYSTMVELVGMEVAEKAKAASLEIYIRGADHARDQGIIIADTKFEFGLLDGELILVDEVLTPDSSRFWPEDQYGPGRSQPSFDKQYVRDYLESINWNKEPPVPELPDEIVTGTTAKYLEAFRRITGRPDPTS
jgi:phosphoribosylaminoimidazole-succinocarboxamide synthase